MNYGKEVKKRLIDKQMSQKELAIQIGCSKFYLSKILSGKKSGKKYKEKINEVLDLKEEA